MKTSLKFERNYFENDKKPGGVRKGERMGEREEKNDKIREGDKKPPHKKNVI